MPNRTRSHFDRFLKPILASRFLTISALIHLVIIFLFGGKVLFERYVEPPDFQSTGDGAISTDMAAPPPGPPEAALPPPQSMVAPPPVSAPATSLTAITSLNASATAFAMPLPAIPPPTLSKNLSTSTPVQQFGQGPAVTLPGQMSSRSDAGRGMAGSQYGQKPASEAAVMRALQWLQTQQTSDGTWVAGDHHCAYTGLALLCYLGHGETPQTSHEFGVVVTNAINALVDEAGRNQGHLNGSPGFWGNEAVYQHAICTYALCEAYTMTKDDRLVPVIKEAIDYIVKGQRPDGGWAYSYDISGDAPGNEKSDTSVSGWQIQALKAAHLTGIPGLADQVQPALDNAMKNMDRVFNPKDGSFGYRHSGDRDYALTGVGVLAKLFWLGRADHNVHEGLKNIESKDLAYTSPDCILYSWYYDTQACYQAQGGAWSWWKDRFQNQLTSNQSADGSWPPDNCGVAWLNPERDPGAEGSVYRTTLCCLMLEVFYRYLPTSQDSALGGTGNVHGL